MSEFCCCRADEVIATDKEDVVARVKEITGSERFCPQIAVPTTCCHMALLLSENLAIVLDATVADFLDRACCCPTGGEGAYGALDAVGGSGMDAILDCVRYGGRVFLYGGLGGPQVTYSVMQTIYGVSKKAKQTGCVRRILRQL